MTSEQKSLLSRWRDEAQSELIEQARAERRWARRHFSTGLLLVLLTALTGGSLLDAFQLDSRFVAFLALLTPVLAGAQTFLRSAERAEQHHQTTSKLRTVIRRIDELLVAASVGDEEIIAEVRGILDEAYQEAPVTNYWKRSAS